jgi:two-component system sensor kinase FixL
MRVRRDGSQFLAHVTFTALHDRTGKLRGFAEISHDLSESWQSEARYRGLLEAAPDAMVVVNQAGAIVLWEAMSRPRVSGLGLELGRRPDRASRRGQPAEHGG